ncbi:MAG: ATP-grasp domain-containing protein [Bryobacteraceae bacterium]
MKQDGPRLLLVAATTGYQTRAFAEASERIGVEAVLATDRCHILEDPWADRAIAVRFEDPERSAAKIEGAYDGVIAVGDGPTVLAALAAERLGLRYGPRAAVEACRNKFTARSLYRDAGMRVPEYFRAAVEAGPAPAAARAAYPCVLKPLGLSGSRGVIRANDREEFEAAFRRIAALLERPEVRRTLGERGRELLVESYIEGHEFALEGLVADGRLQVLALFDKPDPLEGPYFEETIYVTPSRMEARAQAEMARAAQEAVRALGLRHGPVHIEMRYNGAGAWILEVAARPIGGLCARVLRFEGGITLEEVLIRHAVGQAVGEVQLAGPAAGVMMIPAPGEGIYSGVDGEDEARAIAGIEQVAITAKAGQKIVPLPDGNSYTGFLFARGGTPEEVEQALREAYGRLRFRIAATLPVVSGPVD